MEKDKIEIKYPENVYLRIEVFKDGRTQDEIAKDIGFSRKVLNETINGKYKGTNLIPALKESLAKQKEKLEESNQSN
jgi:DNA-binding XRE family transcriptional regulator